MDKAKVARIHELLSENYTQAAVARSLGLSRQRVNQLLNPMKHAARVAVHNSSLSSPSVCSQCKKHKNLHAHHEDYSRPLDVLWLCSKCHGERHEALNNDNLILGEPIGNRKPCTECGRFKNSAHHKRKCAKTYLPK